MNDSNTAPRMPDGMAILIERDNDYRPADNIATGDDEADADYVARFDAGELTAYGVMVVPVDEDGNVRALMYRDGSCGPIVLASLWGVDVEHGAADGRYDTLDAIPDEYLRHVASEVIAEALAERA